MGYLLFASSTALPPQRVGVMRDEPSGLYRMMGRTIVCHDVLLGCALPRAASACFAMIDRKRHEKIPYRPRPRRLCRGLGIRRNRFYQQCLDCARGRAVVDDAGRHIGHRRPRDAAVAL